jgi:hypothetical protein
MKGKELLVVVVTDGLDPMAVYTFSADQVLEPKEENAKSLAITERTKELLEVDGWELNEAQTVASVKENDTMHVFRTHIAV